MEQLLKFIESVGFPITIAFILVFIYYKDRVRNDEQQTKFIQVYYNKFFELIEQVKIENKAEKQELKATIEELRKINDEARKATNEAIANNKLFAETYEKLATTVSKDLQELKEDIEEVKNHIMQ